MGAECQHTSSFQQGTHHCHQLEGKHSLDVICLQLMSLAFTEPRGELLLQQVCDVGCCRWLAPILQAEVCNMAIGLSALSALYYLYSQTSTALHGVMKKSFALWNTGQYQYESLRKTSWFHRPVRTGLGSTMEQSNYLQDG